LFQFYDKIFIICYKIRTFEKARSKSASRKSKKTVIDINSSVREVDEFLKKRYGYGIWNFLYSLYETVTLYRIFEAKKEINVLQNKVKKLRSAKSKLIENVDQFLIDTDIWEGIKSKYPDMNLKWTPKKREKFIIRYFNLNQLLKTVDERIENINHKVKFLEIYGLKLKKIRIKPRNFVFLLWSNVMIKGKNEEDVDFKNINALFNWFSINKNWKTFFKGPELISPETPKLTYYKYVKYSKSKLYDDLAFYFYVMCFPDIAEPLIRMFPNPLELSKLDAKGIYKIPESKLKGIFHI
jgi:hypothetical protein